jgi:hypothetical protein
MANYAYTFTSGDTVTPTKLNNARTVSEIVNADVSATAAIAGTKIAPNFGSQNIATTGQVSAGGNFVTQITGFGGLSMTCNATSGNNEIVSRRSRGTPASPTVVQSGDNLITIAGQGYDGSSYANAAFITMAVGAAAGSGDMPGLITFSTTADGASTPTERMRIAAGGSVGIATNNPSELLQIGNGTGFAMPWVYGNSATYGAGLRIWNANTATTAGAFIDFGIGADATVANIHARKQSDGSSDLVLLPSPSTGDVFDLIYMDGSAARVGINTSAPATTLDVNGDVTIADKIIHSGDTNTAIRFPAADTVTVETAGNERLRVHSTGDVSINSAAAGIATTAGGASWQASGFHAIYRNSSTAAEGIVGYYSNWGATQREVTRFQVDGNILNFNNSYGALSDASIKENIEDATPKLDALKQVRVVNFNRIGDPDNKQIGMVAQELEAIWPKLISEDQDGLKSIKYSVLVPILVKAVQELADKVETLETA